MSNKTLRFFKLAPVAAAWLAVCGGASAQQSAEVLGLTSPSSSISVGAGGITDTGNTQRFGQYTGINKDGVALIDFEFNQRDDATGAWIGASGRNLGLDTREIGAFFQKQGDWKVGVDYNEIVRNDPYVIHTGMTGIGTATPNIVLIARPSMPARWATDNAYTASNGVAGHDEQLKLKRTALGLSGEKWFSPSLQLELNLRTEEKKGARMFGRVGIGSGDMAASPLYNASAAAPNTLTNGGWALLLTPEPINSTIQTIEAKLNFNRDKLALSGGYYGSLYTNSFGSLSPVVPGTLNRGALTTTCTSTSVGACNTIQGISQSAVALAPDNQAHQIYASGTYAYNDTTRTNFKLSFTHATQDEGFAGMGLSSAGPSSLDGVVDTTLAQVGLSTRPTKDLSLNASFRYEDRADKTAVAVYNTNGQAGSALNNTTNWPSGSQTRTEAKLDGIYRLSGGYSATAGLDWERKFTPLPPNNTAVFNNQVLFRETLTETGLKLGLRKALADDLNGAIGAEYKQRRGDDNGWRTTSGTAGNAIIVVDAATANRVLPDMYMDRDRIKVRASSDWTPTERLSVEAVLEHGQDDYMRQSPFVAGAFAEVAGARVVTNDSITLDTSYHVSDDWNISGYWTHSENRWKVNKASLADDTRSGADTLGLGLKGKVAQRISIGADVIVSSELTSYYNMPSTGNIAGWTGQTGTVLPGNYLPNIKYDSTKVNLYGIYEVDKKASIRVNAAYQEFRTNDWEWGYNGVPFVYSDNTTVSNPNQAVTFVGVSYIRNF